MSNTLTTLERAHEIMAGLPEPDYATNFQPTYPDQQALFEEVHEACQTEGATTFEQIDRFKLRVASARLLFIFGSCHAPVQLEQSIDEVIAPALDGLDALHSSRLGDHDFQAIYRGPNQSTKPRTDEFQILPDGTRVVSFQGHAVNGEGIDRRTPDPSRIIASVLQARDSRARLQELLPAFHLPFAHEALLMALEEPFVRNNPSNGLDYSLSGDLLWAGVRTNAVTTPQVGLLGRIQNTVGSKIGSNSDEVHIRELSQKLNPQQEPGKLILMHRVSLEDIDSLRRIARSVRRFSPNARNLFDIHAITKQLADKTKIRCVDDLLQGMTIMTEIFGEQGLRLDGVHVESTNQDRFECIDHDGQKPTHPGDVDPRLNSKQLIRVANHLASLQ